MDSNNEKFLSTYGKEASFKTTPIQIPEESVNEKTVTPLTAATLRKYLRIFLFALTTLSLLLVGGIFVGAFILVFAVVFILQKIFGGPSSSSGSFYMMKK